MSLSYSVCCISNFNQTVIRMFLVIFNEKNILYFLMIYPNFDLDVRGNTIDVFGLNEIICFALVCVYIYPASFVK